MTPRRPSRGFWIALGLGVTLIAALFVGWTTVTGGNSFIQRRNMARAEAHIASLGADFCRDPRFVGVELRPYTGGKCGSLAALGFVATQTDLDAFIIKLQATHPPVEIVWLVTVLDPESWSEHYFDYIPQDRRDWFPAPAQEPPG